METPEYQFFPTLTSSNVSSMGLFEDVSTPQKEEGNPKNNSQRSFSNAPHPTTASASFINQPQIFSDDSQGFVQNLQHLWKGCLILENCPQKGQTKPIYVSGYAPEGQPNFKLPSALRISGVCYSSNIQFVKKYSLKMFMLVPETTPGNEELFLFFLSQLWTNGWIGVCDLPENTLLLVPFRQEKLLGIFMTKMNVAVDNSKVAAVSSNESNNSLLLTMERAASMSYKYNREGELKLGDKIPEGFYDPGRSEFLSLPEYQRQAVNLTTREILLLDSTTDSKLASYITRAEEMISNFTDTESQCRVLALFVSNCFGGDFPNANLCAQEIVALKQKSKSNIIAIGDLSHGVCRHRAVLYKYLCDKLNIPCELKRGSYSSNSVTGAHAWNIVLIGMSYFVVDIMHESTQLYSLDSEKAKNYTRLANVGGEWKMSGAFSVTGDPSPASTTMAMWKLLTSRNDHWNALFARPSMQRMKLSPSVTPFPPSSSSSTTTTTTSTPSTTPSPVTPSTSSSSSSTVGVGGVHPLPSPVVEIFEKIGQGGSASVFRGKLGGWSCAVKVVPFGKLARHLQQYAVQEVYILDRLQHPNIVSFLGYELTRDSKELLIFLELFPMSLGHHIEKRKRDKHPFSLQEIHFIGKEILKALQLMHTLKIIHRDLKPENILIDFDDQGRFSKVKLADFGVCKVLGVEPPPTPIPSSSTTSTPTPSTTTTGGIPSPYFMAPSFPSSDSTSASNTTVTTTTTTTTTDNTSPTRILTGMANPGINGGNNGHQQQQHGGGYGGGHGGGATAERAQNQEGVGVHSNAHNNSNDEDPFYLIKLRVGTELYMAPEVHNAAISSTHSDIWSFGMILVELITLSPPYYGMSKHTTLQWIKSAKAPSTSTSHQTTPSTLPLPTPSTPPATTPLPPASPHPNSFPFTSTATTAPGGMGFHGGLHGGGNNLPEFTKILEIVARCLHPDPFQRPSADDLIHDFTPFRFTS